MQETTKKTMFELFKAQNEQAKNKGLKEVKPVILPTVKAEITQPQPEPQPETPKTPVEYFADDKKELSTLTFNDLIAPTETPTKTPIIEEISNFIQAVKPTEETEQKPRIFMSNYSPYSIAITGDTKQIKDVLKDLGGVYNRYLKCGAGWIIPKRKEAEILEELKLYANF